MRLSGEGASSVTKEEKLAGLRAERLLEECETPDGVKLRLREGELDDQANMLCESHQRCLSVRHKHTEHCQMPES